ncbi:MAG: NAD(P)H-dependent oxidoreductase [Deltaproteobacteria bacterium]|jgi:multimeric flavodoxin WrbA
MKIAVLNGSPKGQISVTLQYVSFLQHKFPEIEFQIFDVALKIKKLEEDAKFFEDTIAQIASADAVLWAFPLYFFLVSSQYKRFIELIFERDSISAFRGKPAAVLTTSIKFFDHTAHNYLRDICGDLEMKFFGSYSAEMYDLFKSKERRRLSLFGQMFAQAIKNGSGAIVSAKRWANSTVVYKPALIQQIDTNGKKVLIVVDDFASSPNLRPMLEDFQKAFLPVATLLQLKHVDIKGGCLGCMKCGLDNSCVYEGKDEFIDFFNEHIKTADILFFAGAIHDRFLSSLWKCFFDRSFFNGHIPVLKGKQIGFVIAGSFNQLYNLREILEAYAEMMHANLVGFVSDDMGNSQEINQGLQSIAANAVTYSKNGYIQPQKFYGVAGTKIFRDAVFGKLRIVFQADHKYYKENRFYDFPNKNYKWRIINSTILSLTKIPFIRREFVKRMKTEMIKPFGSILAKLDPRV